MPLPGSLKADDGLVAASFAERLRAQLGSRVLDLKIFGSRARGEARPDSDLDIWVLMDKVSHTDREQICAVATDLVLEGRLPVVSPRIMSSEQFERLVALERLLPREIERDGIPI